MRVLVTGWRGASLAHRSMIWYALDALALSVGPENRPITVVHGACPHGGVDLHVEEWAVASPYGISEAHPAERFGAWPACGPRRNSYMVSLGADLCLGWPGPHSKGTWDCLRKAVDAQIPTRVEALVNVKDDADCAADAPTPAEEQ